MESVVISSHEMWQLYRSQALLRRKRGHQVLVWEVTIWSCLQSESESIPDSYLCCETTLQNQSRALKAHHSLLFHTIISCAAFSIPSVCICLISYPLRGASRTKQGNLQCLWRQESHLGGWQRNKNGGEGEREREWGEEGRLAGKEGMGGGIKLASGHLMTNNGTASHHCRRPAREQKRGGQWGIIASALVFPPLALLSLTMFDWGDILRFGFWKTTQLMSLKKQQIFIASNAAHPTPLIYGSVDTTLIWTKVLPTARQIAEWTNKQYYVNQAKDCGFSGKERFGAEELYW